MMIWLFCGGMPRSGSTLQYQLVSTIVERQGNGCRVGWTIPDDVKGAIQNTQDIPSVYDYCVMKSHVPVLAINNLIDLGTANAFYIYRDLRDVIVSTMWYQGIAFEQVWGSGEIDDAIRWGKSWELMPRVYLAKCEEVRSSLRAEVGRIANHLNFPCPSLIKSEIANTHRIKQQKRITRGLSSGAGYHPTELLHKNHIGKANGLPGQWRHHLTWEQIKAVEDRYGDWLIGHGYDLLIK